MVSESGHRLALAPEEIQRVLDAWEDFLDFWGEDAETHVAKARKTLGTELTEALTAAVRAGCPT